MRKAFALLLLLACPVLVGCSGEEDKPDPREQEGFVDTTDPSKVMQMPADPNKTAEPGQK